MSIMWHEWERRYTRVAFGEALWKTLASWENNIKFRLEQTGWGHVKWLNLAKDRDK
jgi:hypothetical protein